jgi:hypothetical protein
MGALKKPRFALATAVFLAPQFFREFGFPSNSDHKNGKTSP